MDIWARYLGALHRHATMNRRSRRIAHHLSELIPSNSRILDVGSGNGQLAQTVAAMRDDVEIEGLDVISWPNQCIRISEFDGLQIPFQTGEWDYCMACDVLHHCEQPRILLAEMARVAKFGVIVKDHIAESRLDHILLSVMDWIGNRGHGVHLAYNYFSSAQWNSTLSNAGLKPVQTRIGLNLYPAPFTWMFDRELHFISVCTKSLAEDSQSDFSL